jgi:Domain of unknown function (DUF4145)
MKPRYNWRDNNVLARCPNCDAITSFDDKGHSNTRLGAVIIDGLHDFEGRPFSRILWQALRCSVCSRGAMAQIHDIGSSQTAVIGDFIPAAMERAMLPATVPDDIVNEFRESELDAAHGAYRSASAMLRSVLEKALKKNGYEEVDVKDKQGNVVMDKQGNPKTSNRLIDRIDAAAGDGIITETRQKRAHENIRVLGNDVLHDDWREVKEEEFEEAHKYAQRILEDFYDDRPTVESRLTVRGRPFVK